MIEAMKKILAFVLLTVFSYSLLAQEQWSTIQAASGNGPIPIFSIDRDDAIATVVLLPGGPFTIGNKSADTGRPDGINFLVRTVGQFSSEKLNVVLMGKPPRAGDLWNGRSRESDDHGSDVMQVVEFAKELKKPVWLIGTSLGAISAVNTALIDKRAVLSGIVLSSMTFRANKNSGVLSMDVEKLTIPILISGHEKDECPGSNPKLIDELKAKLTSSKKVGVAMISSGNSPTGKPCGPNHWHGYINAEAEAVRSIADFIRSN